MIPSTVLVLGANGRFGQAAVQAFAAAGWQVLAQLRRAPAQPLPAGAVALELPLADAEALARRAAGARVVVYAVNPPYTDWPRQLLPLARQGMDLAQRLGAVFMLPGNVYNFGADMPALLTETTPERPSTAKGRLRAALEAELAARAAQGLRSVVIRAGDFFGGGTGSWLDLVIVKHLRRGKLVYPGPLDLPHAWAYLPDLARAFVTVAARDDLPAHTRLHFAGHTLTGRELLDAVERAAGDLGVRPAGGLHRAGMPWGAMRVLGWFVPMIREVLEMAYLWRVPHALDGHALQATAGALPATPIDVAMPAALRHLGLGTPPGGRLPNAGIVAGDTP
jgi:nucleoside-diphosphate-sugar epimerase